MSRDNAEKSLREQILSKKSLKYKEDTAWGVPVRVNELTGEARDLLEDLVSGKKEKSNVGWRATVLVLSLTDRNGKPIFTLGDVKEVNKMDANELIRLYDIADELSGLSGAALEEAEKN